MEYRPIDSSCGKKIDSAVFKCLGSRQVHMVRPVHIYLAKILSVWKLLQGIKIVTDRALDHQSSTLLHAPCHWHELKWLLLQFIQSYDVSNILQSFFKNGINMLLDISTWTLGCLSVLSVLLNIQHSVNCVALIKWQSVSKWIPLCYTAANGCWSSYTAILFS